MEPKKLNTTALHMYTYFMNTTRLTTFLLYLGDVEWWEERKVQGVKEFNVRFDDQEKQDGYGAVHSGNL